MEPAGVFWPRTPKSNRWNGNVKVSSEKSVDLLAKWKAGDEDAARILFERYVNQLCGLARNRLSERMQRRVEPEDIVHSAYRSFFRKADDEVYTLSQSGDLWKLLAAITINKLRGQVEFHTAKKRGVYTEESLAAHHSTMGLGPQAIGQEPSPEDAVAVIEELQTVLSGLDPMKRQVLELALQNYSEAEIAQEVQRSARTVRRVLQELRSQLESRLGG